MLGSSTSVSFRSDGGDAAGLLVPRARREPSFSGARQIAAILESSAGAANASGGRISELLASGSALNLSQAIDQLNPTERNALQARWGRSLDELISLSNERDARVFHHGLLQVGRRLEDNDQIDLSGVVYSSLVAEGSNSPHPPLNLRGGEEVVPPLRLRGGQEGLLPSDVANQAQRRLNAITGVGDWRERFAFSLQRIPNQATRWDVLLAMTGAGFTFRGIRLLTTASWAGGFESALALNAASASTAFLAETIAFTSLGKVAGALAGHPQDTSANGIFNEWAGGAAMLLGLKGMGALTGAGVRSIYGEGVAATATGRLTQILAPQAGMFMGILVGNRLAEVGGFHPERRGDNWLVDGVTTLIEFNVAGRIQRSAGGPALASLEGRMEAMTRNIGHGSGRPGGIWDGRSKDRPLPGIFESMSEWFRPELVTAEGLRLPSFENRPSIIENPHIVFSQRLPEEGGPMGGTSAAPSESVSPGSGETSVTRSTVPLDLRAALRQFNRIQEPTKALEALALLYLGSYGPIRPILFDAIVAVEKGAPFREVVAGVLESPRLGESRFFSNEAQMGISYALHRLYQGEEIPLLHFILNGNGRKSSDNLAMEIPNLFKPSHLNIEEQFRLFGLYLRQLADRAKHPPEHWPLSAQLAHGENFALASHFENDGRAVRQVAHTDNLTGVLNREGLEQITPRLEKRVVVTHQREGEGETVKRDHILLVDVDFLKTLNQDYTHPGADIILREVGQLLAQNVRLGDRVARIGGDEFLIFLDAPGRDGALVRAEELRHLINELRLPMPNGKIAEVTVTIAATDMRPLRSLKASEQITSEGSLTAAYSRTSELLLAAKGKGRRNVVVITPEE